MGGVLNSISLSGVAAAIAGCMGILPPQEAGEAIFPICDLVDRMCDGRKTGRVLLYNPDGLAMWLYQKYTLAFMPVMQNTQLAVPLQTVFPTVTPVCFASMYTGALPAVHGIMQYERPVVKIDTLFDAFERAGIRAAIVATPDASMGKIFLERKMDYFIMPNDDKVTEQALELVEKNEHDFLAIYNQEYDECEHSTYPESPSSYQAMVNHISTFACLARATEKHWANYDTLLGFIPDHGIHTDMDGHGTHGENIPEDLNIMSFFGVQPMVAQSLHPNNKPHQGASMMKKNSVPEQPSGGYPLRENRQGAGNLPLRKVVK